MSLSIFVLKTGSDTLVYSNPITQPLFGSQTPPTNANTVACKAAITLYNDTQGCQLSQSIIAGDNNYPEPVSITLPQSLLSFCLCRRSMPPPRRRTKLPFQRYVI